MTTEKTRYFSACPSSNLHISRETGAENFCFIEILKLTTLGCGAVPLKKELWKPAILNKKEQSHNVEFCGSWIGKVDWSDWYCSGSMRSWQLYLWLYLAGLQWLRRTRSLVWIWGELKSIFCPKCAQYLANYYYIVVTQFVCQEVSIPLEHYMYR